MQYLPVENYKMDEEISRNFKLGEFIVSNAAYNQKLYMQYMYQPIIVSNITMLCQHILQPLRDQLGKPIVITSGYRCAALNAIVGGASNSLHKQGFAADIRSPGYQSQMVDILRHMDFHEVIVHGTYVHVGWKQIWREGRWSNETRNPYFDFKP